MATYSVNRGKHATSVAATEDTVNLAWSGAIIRVANRDSTDALYFTIDNTAVTVAGDDTYYVAPGTSVVVEGAARSVPVVRLISSGNCDYSVELY